MKSGYDLFAVFSFLLSSGNVLFHTFEKERVVVIKQSIMVLPVEKRYELSLIIGILLKHQVSSSEVRGGTFLIGGWGLGRRGGSLVNLFTNWGGSNLFYSQPGEGHSFFWQGKNCSSLSLLLFVQLDRSVSILHESLLLLFEA